MRFQNKKISARATALALVLGVVGVLVAALPASAAVISSFSPTCGVSGTAVSITGTGFNSGGAATAVRFGATNQPVFTVVSDVSITTTVPAGAASGPISVDAPTGNTVSTVNFIVAAAGVPTITSFSPASGAVGSSVVITGTNFGCTTSVQFGAVGAAFVVNSATQITATVPAGATTNLLHVTTSGGGPANSATNFTVTAGPTITSFTPTSGNVGTSVTVTGTNLTGVTAVKFNGVTATFTTSTATSVTATVPTGATTGKITVTTPGGTATSLTDFTVTTAPVARTVSGFGFEPHSRVSGQVTVTGSSACHSFVPVVIQKQKGGGWKWVDTTATTASGNFKTYIPPSNGKFRAKVNQLTLANGVVCGGDTSNVVHS
jgi:hypothetical protein